MRRSVGVILAILIIIVMSWAFLSVVTSQGDTQTSPSNNGSVSDNGPKTVTINPATTEGNGIKTVEDKNSVYIVSIQNQDDGQTYYFTNRSMVYKYYKVTHGNYSQPFNCTFHNGTLNGIKNANIITQVSE